MAKKKLSTEVKDLANDHKRLAQSTRNPDDKMWHKGMHEAFESLIEDVKGLEARTEIKGMVPKAIASRNLWIGISTGSIVGAIVFNLLFQWLLNMI